MSEKTQSLTLPLLITRSMVLFPETQALIDAARDFSIEAIKASKDETDNLFFVSVQKNEGTEKPLVDDIADVGVLCRIVSISDRGDRLKVRVEIIDRVSLTQITMPEKSPYYIAKGDVNSLESTNEDNASVYVRSVREALDKAPTIMQSLPRNIANVVARTTDPVVLCYNLVNNLRVSTEQKQKALEIDSIDALVPYVITLLNGETQKEIAADEGKDRAVVCRIIKSGRKRFIKTFEALEGSDHD